ncbi:EndoU domain-containing protein, partial [bacterium]|nr:EndoU domain-containing protein [bacterium]
AKQKKINEEAKRKEHKRKALQKQQAKIKKKQPVQNYFLKRKNEIKSKASRTFYRNKNRAFAIRKAVDNNFKIFCQQYQLSKQAIGILNQNHIDTRIFEECIGNSIQQQLHSEFIDVLNKGADTYTAQDGLTGIAYLANNNWYATLAKVSFIGSHVNNIGQYTLAYKIADICDGIHRIVKNSTHNSLKNIHDNSVKINDIWRVAIQCVGRATQKAGNAVVDFTQGVEQKAIARPARFLTEFAYTLENNPEAVFTAASTVLLESVNYLFDSAQLIGTITNNPLSEKTIELLVEFEQNWVEPLCKKVSHAAKVFWKMPPKEKTQELVALGVQALAIVGATKLVAALPAQVMLLKTSALLQLDKLSRISEPILQTVILPDGRATITIQAVECMSEELVAAAEQTIAVAVSTNVGLVMPVAVDTVSTAMLAMKNGPPYQRKTKIAREKASKIRKRKIRPSEEIVQEYKNLAETKVEWQGSYDLSEVENISIPQKIKFSKKSLEHAFSGKVEKLPGNGPLKISGYHSDFQGKALSKSGMNMSKIKDYKTGAFDAKIRLCGKIRKKTMFPESWRPQKVLDTTCNALKNVTKIKKLDYGRLRYVGRSDCGIEIEVITEFNGEVITFYPKLSL